MGQKRHAGSSDRLLFHTLLGNPHVATPADTP
jgi:hypothetical protein